MTETTKFKALQDIYVSKKLTDDFYWIDMVSSVSDILENFGKYLGAPPPYTSEAGRKEYYVRFVSYNGEKLVPLDAKKILKKGQAFDFRLDLALDSVKSENERVSEIVSAEVRVEMPEKGQLSFLVGTPPKAVTVTTRAPEPFYEAVYAVFKSKIEQPVTLPDIK